MEYISNILKEFNSKQKLFVLVLLLIFTSITSILTTYLTSDYNSCSVIIEENKALLEDYVVITKMIREQQIAQMVDSAAIAEANEPRSGNPQYTYMDLMDSVLLISEKHIK
jgi:hypothetical protein